MLTHEEPYCLLNPEQLGKSAKFRRNKFKIQNLVSHLVNFEKGGGGSHILVISKRIPVLSFVYLRR